MRTVKVSTKHQKCDQYPSQNRLKIDTKIMLEKGVAKRWTIIKQLILNGSQNPLKTGKAKSENWCQKRGACLDMPGGSAGRAAAPSKIKSSLLSLFSAPSCYPLGFASRSSRHLRFSFVTVLSRILLFTLSQVFQYSTSFSVRLMESTRRSTWGSK